MKQGPQGLTASSTKSRVACIMRMITDSNLLPRQLGFFHIPRAPSIHMVPTLGSKVCK